MTTSPKIIAVIPAYNEETTVGAVVASLKPLVAQVIVVDDHSTDNTADAARVAGAIVSGHEENLGYDISLDDGFKLAAKMDADIFMTFDADGEHDVRDVPKILEPILSGKADIVAGQRPHSRHIGERLFALYTFVRFYVRDPLCGFKAYRRTVYDAVGHFDSLGSIGTELMLRGIRKGFPITLVPITLHARQGSTTRFYEWRLRGTLKILKALVRVLSI